eukprot:GFYU01006298.1.p1 GENE.GFYU01006298.1~~GFYU01006298.1.p1  ORF type:complete len:728 (+),score=225.38 GFYU01006298.1:112-2295(+)
MSGTPGTTPRKASVPRSPAAPRSELVGEKETSILDHLILERETSGTTGTNGSIDVFIAEEYIEIKVKGKHIPTGLLFSYERTDTIKNFISHVQEGCENVELSVEVMDAGGTKISEHMSHKLCWTRPGRRVYVGGVEYEVNVSSYTEDEESDQGAAEESDNDVSEGHHRPQHMKYLLVTGGVLSGIGKGVTTSSMGMLLKASGLRVTALKIDPYLNIDAGTMSPFEHGEVFVLDDGGEGDLDLGNYERFMDLTLTKESNLTSGKIYKAVLEKERKGDYLGKTVQVVPHVTNEIMNWIERVAAIPTDDTGLKPQVCVIELGGTVGDIESMPYVEALRQFSLKIGRENICHLHVSLVPEMGPVGEQKTKPTQHSHTVLRGCGLIPDIIVCRSTRPLEREVRQKIGLFCDMSFEHVVSAHDTSNIYQVPMALHAQGTTALVAKCLKLKLMHEPALKEWTALAKSVDNATNPIRIAVVGKYTGLQDSYLSVIKALLHACIHAQRKLVIDWIEASDLEDARRLSQKDKYDNAWVLLRSADGVLVPGGFGNRGTEGKILAAKFARESGTPYLGICLGFQVAVIEYARTILGLTGANTTEFEQEAAHPVVIFMPEGSKTHMGGTMRLGTRKTILSTMQCKAARLYSGHGDIMERHRHRYEVNPEYVPQLEEAGLKFVGRDESGQRMQILEIPSHRFFFATQAHPEFKSRPLKPSPPFLGFIMAACGHFNSTEPKV